MYSFSIKTPTLDLANHYMITTLSTYVELIDANNMADIEEELLLQANLFLLSSPKATTTSASKPKETSVLKNIYEETRTWDFFANCYSFCFCL